MFDVHNYAENPTKLLIKGRTAKRLQDYCNRSKPWKNNMLGHGTKNNEYNASSKDDNSKPWKDRQIRRCKSNVSAY
jgi:hypothetical protein